MAGIGFDGKLLDWVVTTNIPSRLDFEAFAATDSVVYIGGHFGLVNGSERHNLAAVDKAGDLTPLTMGSNDYVPLGLAISDDVLYLQTRLPAPEYFFNGIGVIGIGDSAQPWTLLFPGLNGENLSATGLTASSKNAYLTVDDVFYGPMVKKLSPAGVMTQNPS